MRAPVLATGRAFSSQRARAVSEKRKAARANQLSPRVTFTAHIVSRTGIFDLQVDARMNSSFLIKSTVRATGGSSA